MKHILGIVLLLLLYSCSDTDDVKEFSEGLPQTWRLAGLNAGLSGEYFEADDLPFQETIQLANDSTFVRTRIQDTATLEATGVFEIRLRDDQEYLVLWNTEQNELISNCTRTLEEWFLFTSNITISGGGLPCDRPGLDYRRME